MWLGFVWAWLYWSQIGSYTQEDEEGWHEQPLTWSARVLMSEFRPLFNGLIAAICHKLLVCP
jgi:hypothetical protein